MQTLDVVSGGRVEFGVGAGWLAGEWAAAGLDFGSRGRRLDEAIAVCRRLWTEPAVEHHGEFYRFGAVGFEPKPQQKPWPRVHVGGESMTALRRAVARGDGWIGGQHTPASAAVVVARLRDLRVAGEEAVRPFEVTVGGEIKGPGDIEAWIASGVTRVIVAPWSRSSGAIDSLNRLAEAILEG